MLRGGISVVYFVTFYLFVYSVFLQFETTVSYAVIMLIFSPLLICRMVYCVLKHDKYNGTELGDDEFGYQDKPKADLGVF